MKTKNLYYHTVFRRANFIKMAILTFFLAIASWPRLLIEVFIRKNFGERYFSFSTAIVLTWILGIFPYAWDYSHSYGRISGFWYTVMEHWLWYAYLAVFVYFAWQRRAEIKRQPGVFDFAKFSLSTGVIDPRFYTLEIPGINSSPRNISILFEPLPFFLVGAILAFFGVGIGFLLIASSICYSLSYAGAYHLGDEFVMDKIDEMICSEEMVDSFVNDRPASETKGFEAYGKRPANPEFRRKVVDSFFDKEDFAEAF